MWKLHFQTNNMTGKQFCYHLSKTLMHAFLLVVCLTIVVEWFRPATIVIYVPLVWLLALLLLSMIGVVVFTKK